MSRRAANFRGVTFGTSLRLEEILGLRLITLHNLHFYLNLMSQARTEIENGTFDQFRKAFVAEYKTRDAIPVE